MKKRLSQVLTAALLISLSVTAQQTSLPPDLSKINESKSWKVVSRKVTVNDGVRKAVQFNEAPGQGIAWLEGVEFTNGVIECDIRGKDELQKSFVGIAFRLMDETTQDAVYFRPFNFKTEDPVRRVHAVQYVSHPTFTWEKLRNDATANTKRRLTRSPTRTAGFTHVS